MKIELYHDNFQNYKRYGIPRAQLVIADIPYNIGKDAYGSNPMWYVGGDKRVVEDAKGIRTKEYILKRKMMLWVHGITIKEV